MTVSDDRDLVAALLGVPGVAAAAVEPHGGGPGTLRLQLASGADEVDVAGAVNRLLRSQFGLAVDADRVRVLESSRPTEVGGRPAAVPEPEFAATAAGWPPAAAPHRVRGAERRSAPAAGPAPEAAAERHPAPAPGASPEAAAEGHPAPAPGPSPEAAADEKPTPARSRPAPVAPAASTGRLVIERVQLVSARLGITVSVTLRSGELSVVGEVEGPATSTALHRTVAAATLRAVEAVVDDDVRFDVEHVEIASTGAERTALVVVSLVTERGSQRLSGASVVRDDARQAVIRAVLAAVNRRVAPMLPGADG